MVTFFINQTFFSVWVTHVATGKLVRLAVSSQKCLLLAVERSKSLLLIPGLKLLGLKVNLQTLKSLP